MRKMMLKRRVRRKRVHPDRRSKRGRWGLLIETWDGKRKKGQCDQSSRRKSQSIACRFRCSTRKFLELMARRHILRHASRATLSGAPSTTSHMRSVMWPVAWISTSSAPSSSNVSIILSRGPEIRAKWTRGTTLFLKPDDRETLGWEDEKN